MQIDTQHGGKIVCRNKSRRLQATYRQGTPGQRAEIEARMQSDPELAAYVVSIPARDYVVGLIGVAAVVALKVSGYL